jgi:hypothetical protein
MSLDKQDDTLATVIRPFKGYVEVEIERSDGSKQKLVVKPSALKQLQPEKEDNYVTDSSGKPRILADHGRRRR